MRLTHSRRALIVLGAASLSLVVTAGVAPARAMQMATGLTVRVSALNAGTRVIPAHVPAGIVPFTVIDDLTEPASALIFRVNTGYTPAQAIAIFTDQKATQARLNRAASFVAGFTAFAPGQHLSGWIHLTPGTYVVSSLGNFRAHTQTFRVDAAARAPLGAPASAATVTMEWRRTSLPCRRYSPRATSPSRSSMPTPTSISAT